MTQKDYQKAVCLFEPDPSVRERVRAAAERERKPQRVSPLRTALIAACVCLVLVGTAFAANPGLREMLLGGFVPYAQEQENRTYVIDGIEFKVRYVLADDFTVRAYVEARDLEGGLLNKLVPNETGSVFGVVDVPTKDTGNSEGMGGFVTSGTCLGYDAETKTALLSVTSWGQVLAEDTSGSEVKLFSLNAGPGYQLIWENTEGVTFPVDVKPVPSLSMDAGMKLTSAFQAEEVRLSSLGLSVIFRGDGAWCQFAGTNVRAKLTDGTLVEVPWEGGQGSYGAYGTETERKVLVWNFREPVETEQIQGIYVGEDYFPI